MPRLIALIAALLAATAFLGSSERAARAQAEAVGHLRLIDRLDRPEDGYCLDVLGVRDTLRTELPIFAHNCKSGLTPDSAVAISAQGEIRFVEIDLCATVFGVNGAALPGAPIVLRGCGDEAPFFESALLQQFEWTEDRRLRLRDTTLCLSAGPDAATTYSLADRWRVLSVARCDAVPTNRAAWEFVRLN